MVRKPLAGSRPRISRQTADRVLPNSQGDYGLCDTTIVVTATATATTSTTSHSTTTSSAAPSVSGVVSGGSGFHLLGCYHEPGGGVRALANLYADDDMTVAACLAHAASERANWAGLEYGRECWFGNTLDAGTTAEGSYANCQMACSGDANHFCGAGDHLIMYAQNDDYVLTQPETVGSYSWYGCMTDEIEDRALTGSYVGDDDMTLETCATICSGYQYFGCESVSAYPSPYWSLG